MEIWKDITGYENLYAISNKGNVKSLPKLKHTPHGTTYTSKEKLLKQSKMKNGYWIVSLSKNSKKENGLIHRLVALMFVDNPYNKPDVNHDNGNKNCNEDWNLVWVTKSENMIHAFSTGLISKTRKRKVA